MAFNPSAAHPDAEFTINNFSKISGINPANGLYIQGFNSMPGRLRPGNPDRRVGSRSLPAPQGINTPEPTTWLAWLLLAGGAGWQYRRRLAARP